MQQAVTFTVIIPSRNRPVLFAEALASVLGQSCDSIEVVVVKDGSAEEHEAAYGVVAQQAGSRTRFFDLPRTLNGHGQSYALNYGAGKANGDYLCFLDDDDSWTDMDYLRRVQQSIAASGGALDLHLTDQAAFVSGRKVDRVVWIEDLMTHLDAGRQRDLAGAVTVTVPELLKATGFCHVNTTIIRKSLFTAMGGFDDDIRYENDRDFYFRAIDKAKAIRYSPFVVSRHNVPDPIQKTSMSTLVSDLEKRIFQIRVMDKAIVFSRWAELRSFARRHKGYVLKKMAQELARVGSYDLAAFYAREALLIAFTPGWLAYCISLHFKRNTRLT
jgi:glycosyltransferase involved in cell wall biosynthesis